MLGYVKPFAPELRLREFELYKGVYCGLCKELGRNYGILSRLTLSYDFAFLSLLYLSLQGTPPAFERQRCMMHPFKKRSCCTNTSPLALPAATAMIMSYYKVKDNLEDNGFKSKLLAYLAYPIVNHSFKQAKKQQPQIEQIVCKSMEAQRVLEQSGCTSIDAASEPTAAAMSQIAMALCTDPTQQRVLERFGYLLGRWVYLIDALDDMEDDMKRGCYNPFVLKYNLHQDNLDVIATVKKEAKASLYLTIAELAATYELLELTQYKPILDNIIYLGLKDSADRLELSNERKKKYDRPI